MSRNSSLSSSMLSTSSAAHSIGKETEHIVNRSAKEPQMSWFLTIFLLIIVTGVRHMHSYSLTLLMIYLRRLLQ